MAFNVLSGLFHVEKSRHLCFFTSINTTRVTVLLAAHDETLLRMISHICSKNRKNAMN
jgi:ABC-type ATPase involved in cell division